MALKVIKQYQVDDNYYNTPQGALSAVEKGLSYWRKELSNLLLPATTDWLAALASEEGVEIINSIAELQEDQATLLNIIEGKEA